jgi:hypothetical protein
MKQSLEQKVIEQCRLYGCNLGIYRGSHYIIEANDYGDQRTWITGSHSLTQYIEGNPNDALRELLYLMLDGFENRGNCDDGDDCEICTTTEQTTTTK